MVTSIPSPASPASPGCGPTFVRAPRRPTLGTVLGASASLLISACIAESDEPVPGAPGEIDPAVLGQARVQLTRAQSCDELLASIQEGAVLELRQRVEEYREAVRGNGQGGDPEVAPEEGLAPGIPGSVAPPTTQNPASPVDSQQPAAGGPSVEPNGDAAFEDQEPRVSGQDDGAGESGSLGDPNGGFSGTTVQVVDVDEADIVKTDGNRIFVLHGGTLLALDAWPADALSIAASALIEGEPTEMFVHEGKAVVFSRVYDDLAVLASQSNASESRYYYEGTAYTKITVLDVSTSAEQPGIVREERRDKTDA